jgi:hypothetical protein
MQISTAEEYSRAMTEIGQLQAAAADDEAAQTRLRELEAAAAHYNERLRATNPEKGRPSRS